MDYHALMIRIRILIEHMTARYIRSYFGQPDSYHQHYINAMIFLVKLHNTYAVKADPIDGWANIITGWAYQMGQTSL